MTYAEMWLTACKRLKAGKPGEAGLSTHDVLDYSERGEELKKKLLADIPSRRAKKGLLVRGRGAWSVNSLHRADQTRPERPVLPP